MLDCRLKLKQSHLKAVEFYLTEEPTVSDIIDWCKESDDIEEEELDLNNQVIDLEVSPMAAGMLHHLSLACGNDSRSTCGNVQAGTVSTWDWCGKAPFQFQAYYMSAKGTKVIIPSSISLINNL